MTYSILSKNFVFWFSLQKYGVALYSDIIYVASSLDTHTQFRVQNIFISLSQTNRFCKILGIFSTLLLHSDIIGRQKSFPEPLIKARRPLRVRGPHFYNHSVSVICFGLFIEFSKFKVFWILLIQKVYLQLYAIC